MSNLTRESLLETLKAFEPLMPRDPPGRLFGMPVIEHPICAPQPKFQLSEGVMVTPEFRREFNQWAIEFFGYKEPERAFIMRGIYGQMLVMAPGRSKLFGVIS